MKLTGKVPNKLVAGAAIAAKHLGKASISQAFTSSYLQYFAYS